jgi:hypothetical protein
LTSVDTLLLVPGCAWGGSSLEGSDQAQLIVANNNHRSPTVGTAGSGSCSYQGCMTIGQVCIIIFVQSAQLSSGLSKAHSGSTHLRCYDASLSRSIEHFNFVGWRYISSLYRLCTPAVVCRRSPVWLEGISSSRASLVAGTLLLILAA